MVSLSDGHVSVHDIGISINLNGTRTPAISIRTQLTKAKYASIYAIDTSTPEYRLCVATQKKKLHFYRLVPGSKEFEEVCERPIPDYARCLAWAGSRICIGYKREYVMLDIKSGATQELFDTGKAGIPIATVMPNQQLLLNKVPSFVGFLCLIRSESFFFF